MRALRVRMPYIGPRDQKLACTWTSRCRTFAGASRSMCYGKQLDNPEGCQSARHHWTAGLKTPPAFRASHLHILRIPLRREGGKTDHSRRHESSSKIGAPSGIVYCPPVATTVPQAVSHLAHVVRHLKNTTHTKVESVGRHVLWPR